MAAITISVAGGFAAILYKFSPMQARFYPVCPIRLYTGLLCPGCGATRALAALVQGHVREAMQQNGLFTLLLPILLFYVAAAYERSLRGGVRIWPRMPKSAVALMLFCAAVFTIVRNFK